MQTRVGRFSIMLVVCSALFLIGLYNSARSVLLQPISEDFSVSYTGSGLIFLVSFLSVLLANLGAGPLMQRFGMRAIYLVSVVGIALLLCFQSLTTDYTLFLTSTFILTVFSSSQNLTGNSIVVAAFPRDGCAKLNLLHVFYGLGSLAAPFFITLLKTEGPPLLLLLGLESAGLGWREVFAALAILFGLVLLWYPFYQFRFEQTAKRDEAGHSFRQAWTDRYLRKLTLAIFFATGYEVSVSSWLVYTLEQGVGLDANLAGLAIAVFFAGQAAGRASGSWLAKSGRLDELLYPLTLIQAFLAIVSLLLLEALPGLFALAGLTSSVFFPTLFYKVAEECRFSAGRAVYLTGSGLGMSLFPFLVGVVGDLVGIRWGFLIAVLCAILLVPILKMIVRDKTSFREGRA